MNPNISKTCEQLAAEFIEKLPEEVTKVSLNFTARNDRINLKFKYNGDCKKYTVKSVLEKM